ncbi:MAG: BlaI/MecI/CopY family transcriptional regulator [Planctomycetia bacterium]|nr:BlaI/MecI/CopY family transcriptional regulator [Planctomycetia bacterium]
MTAAQHEILESVWAAQGVGATVTQIWETIRTQRPVTRTTVLNLVDRLERRGWLKRKKGEGPIRYLATIDRATAARTLAEGFVDEFFGGSASQFVMSLLGGKRLNAKEVQRLRKLLDSARTEEDEGEDGG